MNVWVGCIEEVLDLVSDDVDDHVKELSDALSEATQEAEMLAGRVISALTGVTDRIAELSEDLTRTIGQLYLDRKLNEMRAVERIRSRTRSLYSTVTHIRAQARFNELDEALALVRVHRLDLENLIARARSRSLLDEHVCTDKLGKSLDACRTLAQSHLRSLARIRDLDAALIRARARAFMLDGATTGRIGRLNITGSEEFPSGISSSSTGPIRCANQLLHVGIKILPPEHQSRYGEELHGELYELAANGASMWRQMYYALHVFNRAWELRAELKTFGPNTDSADNNHFVE